MSPVTMENEMPCDDGSRSNRAKAGRIRKSKRRRKQDRIVRLIQELLHELGCNLDANGVHRLFAAFNKRTAANGSIGMTINALCNTYQKFANSYYRSHSAEQPREANAVQYALKPVREFFGRTPAAEFGPPHGIEIAAELIIEIALLSLRGRHVHPLLDELRRLLPPKYESGMP